MTFLAWGTFYSGELGTFGNTDDILAPASCLESNVRFNFDRLFEKQTYQAGSPDDPLCLEPQAPVPTCLGLTSFWQHDHDGELTGRKRSPKDASEHTSHHGRRVWNCGDSGLERFFRVCATKGIRIFVVAQRRSGGLATLYSVVSQPKASPPTGGGLVLGLVGWLAVLRGDTLTRPSRTFLNGGPNRLGAHRFHLPHSPQAREMTLKCFLANAFRRPTATVTPKPRHRKSHIFSSSVPCLFLKQMFEFQPVV